MYILGIFNDHNATACLMKDGEILGLVSEERFNRIKNYRGFPKEAIQYLLKKYHIRVEDIDIVTTSYLLGALAFVPNSRIVQQGRHRVFRFIFRSIIECQRIFSYIQHIPIIRFFYRATYFFFQDIFNSRSLQIEKKFLSKELGIPIKKIQPRDHHLSHAAAAYYTSPYRTEKALVFTADGGGEGICASVDLFEGNRYTSLARSDATHSLGMIFYYLTAYMGMRPLEHEYKIMGLAPYAKISSGEKVYERIKDWVMLNPKNKMQFTSQFDTHYAYRYIKASMHGQRFDNIAYAFQKLLEDRVVEWVRETIRMTGIHTVCLGGGLFMNVKMNMLIGELKEVERLYILPSCGDESTVLGACYLSYNEWCKNNFHSYDVSGLTSIYLGPSYTNGEIEQILHSTNLQYQYIENIEDKVADLLSKKRVVAIMQGQMEFGARALGNRSILANPSDIHVVKMINDQVKKRDFWMPFAPTILADRASDYFVNEKNFSSSYMMMTFRATKLAEEHFIAALHPYDNTMRPQLLHERENPRYYKIIRSFEKRTGIGGVLNTSFNIHGLPIVLDHRQAIVDFQNSGLEYLVLENYLVWKK